MEDTLQHFKKMLVQRPILFTSVAKEDDAELEGVYKKALKVVGSLAFSTRITHVVSTYMTLDTRG